MGITEMAEYIRENNKLLPRLIFSDEGVVLCGLRQVLYQYVHVTDEHVFECCEKADSYEEFIELCRPLAIIDEEKFQNGTATKRKDEEEVSINLKL